MKIPCCFFPPCWDDDDDDMYLPSFFDIFIMLLSADRCDKHIRYDNRSDTSLVVDEDIFKVNTVLLLRLFPHTINSCQTAHIYIVFLRMRHIN